METENVCFFGGSAMTAESKYDAEPITWWKCLQRATKYVQGESLINMGPLKVISSSFFSGSAMTAESKYDAEPITWWKCLQRTTKYVEMAVYIHIQGKSLRNKGPKCRWTLKVFGF